MKPREDRKESNELIRTLNLLNFESLGLRIMRTSNRVNCYSSEDGDIKTSLQRFLKLTSYWKSFLATAQKRYAFLGKCIKFFLFVTSLKIGRYKQLKCL